jgi:radical SAM superfamily enzyme YgiQ (UPF0313 family)
MRVLLISANRESINMVSLPLGLAFVAQAARRAGHDVEMLDLMRTDDHVRAIEMAIRRVQPEVIGISVRNIDDQNMASPVFLLDQARETAALCRRLSDAPIVLGGAGYSIFPQAALDYVGADMGIQGEGESVFAELLDRLENERDLDDLPGLYLPGAGLQTPRGFLQDLDGFWPDAGDWFSGGESREEILLPVQSRRGCPLRCSYCSTPDIEGTRIRKCSAESVAEYIRCQAEAGFRRIFFTDNTFNLPPSFAKALCRALISREVKVGWRAIVYPGQVDEKLTDLMAKAGCFEVSLGAESGSARMLKSMGKRFTPGEIRRARRLFGDHGVRVMGFLMFGMPGETRETVQESLDLMESLAPDALRLTMGVRIYPNTPLAETAVARGMISADDNLLRPKFFMEPGLQDWVDKTVRSWAEGRPYCIF